MAIKPTKLFRLRILAAIGLLAVCGLVRAEVAAWEPHWYLSLNAGENEVDKSRWEDSETTAVFVGYQFEPHIAVELGYVDLGEFDYTELADTSVEIDGYELCRRIKKDDGLRDVAVILMTELDSPRGDA